MPTQHRARQIELWRGIAAATAGDAAGMRQHLERAVKLALDHGRAAARCEALAWLALSSAVIGANTNDETLLDLAETSALDAKNVASLLPGQPTWGAQAEAALARAKLARGRNEEAADHARSALRELDEQETEDAHLEIVIPAARALLEGGSDEEKEQIRGRLQFLLAAFAQRIMDQEIRVRWLRGPWGAPLGELAGPIQIPEMVKPIGMGNEEQTQLLSLLVEGKSNTEIAEAVGTTEEAVALQLSELFARLGTSSRAEATAFALIGRMV